VTNWTAAVTKAYLLPPMTTFSSYELWYSLVRARITGRLEHPKLVAAFERDLDGEPELMGKIASCRSWAWRLVTDQSRRDQAKAAIWEANTAVLDDWRNNPWHMHRSKWRLDKAVRRGRYVGLVVTRNLMSQNVESVR
jgi:hypothetical protein